MRRITGWRLRRHHANRPANRHGGLVRFSEHIAVLSVGATPDSSNVKMVAKVPPRRRNKSKRKLLRYHSTVTNFKTLRLKDLY